MKNIELLAPRLRNEINAAEFADYLADAMGKELMNQFDGAGWYVWDTAIPPMSDWCNEITNLVAHLESL